MMKNFLNKFIFFIPLCLPVLITFSRSIADITVVIVSLFFIINSYIENDWQWVKTKWFTASLIFWFYCLFLVSPFSINFEKSFLYSLYFIRWPIFCMALSYWIFKDIKNIKNFLKIIFILTLFFIFDTWWQYFFSYDLLGYKRFDPTRLTGPFDRPIIGMWISKLSLLIPFLLIFNQKFKVINKLIKILYLFFLLVIITIFITGERMAFIFSVLFLLIYSVGLYFDNYISFKNITIFFLIIIMFGFLSYWVEPNMFKRSIISTLEIMLDWKKSDYGLIFKSAYLIWNDNIILGSGFHTYRQACEELLIYGTRDNPIVGGMCFHPHNIALEILSELGLVGFIMFYSIILYMLYEARYLLINKKWFVVSIILAVFFGCFFPLSIGMSIFSNKLASIIWMICGVTMAYIKIHTLKMKRIY
jgi:O-antigen ligase